MIDADILQGIIRVDQSAINTGALILACCRADLKGFEIAATIDLEMILKEKQLDMTHDFAYQTRKVIERAGKVSPDLLISLKKVKPHKLDEGAVFRDGKRVNFTNQSFWWIINRIVHSQQAKTIDDLSSIIEESTRVDEGHAFVIENLNVLGPRVIAFRSNHDDPGIFYYVGLENLVIAYLDKIRKPIFDAMRTS
ncbi:MAG TPA: hypothetical protein VKF36_03205 [Syntrophorhabdales bacterium]|nr:hypothetical protein [Syntrophorhabdales bacterium]